MASSRSVERSDTTDNSSQKIGTTPEESQKKEPQRGSILQPRVGPCPRFPIPQGPTLGCQTKKLFPLPLFGRGKRGWAAPNSFTSRHLGLETGIPGGARSIINSC
jgi:hypothetical protein